MKIVEMKIAILTLGTRGDIQPYAVLGQALKLHGHQVTLSTAKNFESLVRSYDVDFAPVDADFQAIVDSEEGKKMMKNPFRARKHLSKWVCPMISNSLITFYDLAKESDKVLYHIKTLADHFADQFPEKMIRANVIPAFEPTKEFINPVFSALPLPAFLNKYSYKLTELGLRMWHKPIKQFRKNAGLPAKYTKVNPPSIYGISSHFLRKPADYPRNSHFTGFWNGASPEALNQDVVNFIHQGEPPLLLTFGSMPFNSKMNLPEVLKRLTEKVKIRLIIVKGWGLSHIKELEDNSAIKVIESVPYAKLLPFVKAAIHHGGIGTIAACLQAGKPFLTCPVLYPLGDQHFWGTIAYQSGVALKPIPLKKLTEDVLISNVRALLNTKHLYNSSFELMHKIRVENGVLNAINFIETTDSNEGFGNR